MRTRTIVALASLFLAGGCALPLHSSSPDPTPTDETPATDASSTAAFADARPQGYVLVKPEAIGVTTAADDGRHTFIGLAAPVPPDLRVFDAEGPRLDPVSQGRVLGVAGVHSGILLRRQDRNSFVAKDRTAPADPATVEPSRDPDYQAVQAALEARSEQMAAFQQAIRKADESQASPQSAADQNQPDPLPVTGNEASDTYQVLASGDMLIRVFFAFGGLAIVRPDDGLLRLELQAKRAGSIRLTGFTDSIGPKAVNDALALKRAQGIARFLESRGVPADRMTVEAVGAADFMAPNSTWQGRASNRRVEARFIESVAQR